MTTHQHNRMIPESLKILHYYEQAGIDIAAPRFSWQLSSLGRGCEQIAYRILISDSELELIQNIGHTADSGKVSSDEQSVVIRPDLPFLSNTQYYWKVCVWDQNDHAIWSETTSFITGFMNPSEWQASWINNHTTKPFYARRSFHINKQLKSAFSYVCGLGQFTLFINGQKVSDHELDPGWTNYHESVQYVTFDVTDMVLLGENAIGVSVGNGFYSGDDGDRNFYVAKGGYAKFGNPTMIMEMHIEYTDGTKEVIVSDPSWKAAASATTLANVYGSEDYDARRYPEGWNRVGFDDSSWQAAISMNPPRGILTPQKQPPIIVKKVYDTIHITNPLMNTYVFDLGQNMAGIFEIHISGRTGSVVTIRPGELLNEDGTVSNPDNINTYCQYTLKGNDTVEVWRPDFSYYGARWVQIEGATRDHADHVLPYIHDVKGYYVTSAANDSGVFVTEDERINKLHHIIVKAIESNLQSVHTDCPHIEKLGWLEASHLMAPSIMYNKDVLSLWTKILRDIIEAQLPNGLIPSISPEYCVFEGPFRDSIGWGSAVIQIPWMLYHTYGDTSAIEYSYTAMKKYMAYVKTKEVDGGLLNHGLGDWGIAPERGQSIENIDTAIYYWDLNILSKIARMLGNAEDEQYMLEEAIRIKSNYNDKLLTINPETGKYGYRAYDKPESFTLTQANQAMPLYIDMVPAEHEDDVISTFLDTVSKHKMMSGEIGLRFVFQALKLLGRNDIVYEMMMQPEHPSYIRFIDQGETTLPEFWTDASRSRNHDMMGHIMEWLIGSIGGISALSPGYEAIKIAPYIPKDLKGSFCSYESIRGLIVSEWRATETNLMLNVTLPANTTGKVYLPLMDRDEASLAEGETMIYNEQQFLTNTEGVSFIGVEIDRSGHSYLVLDISSGTYRFNMRFVNNPTNEHSAKEH